jgi:hypothetical protein
LRGDDKDVRCNAATALGLLGDASAVEPLIQAIKRKPSGSGKDRGWGERREAATALLAILSRHPSVRIPNVSSMFQAFRKPHGDLHEDRISHSGSSYDCHADHADNHTDQGIAVEIPSGLRDRDF